MVARGISTDGGPPALAVESCCLDGRVGLAKQQGKRVAHRLSKWPTNMEIDGTTHNGPGYRDYTFDQKTAHIGINGQSHIAMEGAKKFPGHY